MEKKEKTIKVAINRCFGGFSISDEALKELVLLESDCLEAYTPKYYYGGDNPVRNGRDWEKEWQNDFAKYRDMGDGVKAHYSSFNVFYEGMLYDLKSSYENEKIRCHKDLISVIEKLGERANGICASIKIIKIPAGVDFHIEEYDGMETIHENHRSWP